MWLNYILAALSGVLYIAACAPNDQFYLMWVAFIPLFFAIERTPKELRTPFTLFRLGLCTSVFIAATGFYWIIHATENYGGLPFIAAFIVFLAFCFTNQLQVPFYILLRNALQKTNFFKAQKVLLAFALGFAYVGIESLNPKLFSDTAGGAFYNASFIRQFADVGGPFALSVLALAVNELLFASIITKKLKGVFISFGLILFLCGYGYARNAEFNRLKGEHANSPLFRTALIQGNIGDFMKVAAEHGETNAIIQVMGQYQMLSSQALAHQPTPDAIVWPETAYPAIYGRPYGQMEERLEVLLRGLISRVKGYLIFGGYDNDLQGLEYNSIFFASPRSNDRVVYRKSTLLMFGETLPFADNFPEMKHWFPTMGFFGRGAGPEVDTLKNSDGVEFKLGPSICYEGLFVSFGIDEALLGADALLNVTNDSWFGEQGEPYQHLSLTRFRSIETRIPMLRATNTGFTVWIDPTGEQVGSTELSKAEVLYADIPKRFFPDSPYMRMARVFGSSWFARLCQLLTAGMLILIYKNRNAKKV
jgi:apolipoprotein N-acyltransferase